MQTMIKKFKEMYCDKCSEKDCKRKRHKMSKCAAIILAIKEGKK